MLKNICKILTIILVFTMLFQIGLGRVLAYSIQGGLQTIIYIDGIEYVIRDTGEETIIKSNSSKIDLEIHLNNDGTGFVNTRDEVGKLVKTNLKINNLLEDKIDVEYVDEEGNITKINETDVDEYKGQMAATAVIGLGSISLKAFITYLLYAFIVSSAVVIIAGVSCKALDYALKNKEVQKSSYYEAYIYKGAVYVSTKKISRSAAVKRIKIGKDIYTYYQSDARSVVLDAGLGCIGPEIDERTTSSGKTKKGVYYYHFHTRNRNGAHAFYGSAYVY